MYLDYTHRLSNNTFQRRPRVVPDGFIARKGVGLSGIVTRLYALNSRVAYKVSTFLLRETFGSKKACHFAVAACRLQLEQTFLPFLNTNS